MAGVKTTEWPVPASIEETDEVLMNAGGKSSRLTLKKLIAKLARITVDDLSTRDKTIVGGLNELNTKTLRDCRNSPVSLFSGTHCSTKMNEYEYITVPNLNDYQEVDVYYGIGDAVRQVIRVNRNGDTSFCATGYASDRYNGSIHIHVDFVGNRIGIRTRTLTGWAYENLIISRVNGILKR